MRWGGSYVPGIVVNILGRLSHLISHNKPYDICSITSPSLRMGKLRHRKVN